MSSMEQVIQKALDGGWVPTSFQRGWNPKMVLANYYMQPMFMLEIAFWRGLAAAIRTPDMEYTKGYACSRCGEPWQGDKCKFDHLYNKIGYKNKIPLTHFAIPYGEYLNNEFVRERWQNGMRPEEYFEKLLGITIKD